MGRDNDHGRELLQNIVELTQNPITNLKNILITETEFEPNFSNSINELYIGFLFAPNVKKPQISEYLFSLSQSMQSLWEL